MTDQPLLPRPALRSADDLCAALELRFSDEQLAAICAPLEPGVIIAGAGSGKTTVMAARVVWLVGTGLLRPDQVLGLTFTRKAAAELAHRVRASLVRAGVAASADDEAREAVMTYDSFASRLVAEHGLRMGLEADPAVVTGAERFQVAARVVTGYAGDLPLIARLRPASVTERVIALDAALQSHLVTTDQVRRYTERLLRDLDEAPRNRQGNVYAAVRSAQRAAAERLELLDLVDGYQRHKAARGITEFADQLAAAARLAGVVGSVGVSLREQYRVVLLDEYQDTSSAQAQLLRELFGGGQHPVTAVGDPFQAIYGWRGAAASSILSFSRGFPRRDGTPAPRYQLSVNRRSQQQILDVANDIGTALRAEQAAVGGPTPLLRAPEGNSGGEVVAAGFATAEEELAWLADRIADQANDPHVDWSQTAVLVRRNGDIPPIYAALVDREVPVEIVGLGGLLALPEIGAVLSTLTLLHDISSDGDLIALFTGPRWRIGPGDLRALGRRHRQLADPADPGCLYDAVLDPGDAPLSKEGAARLRRFVAEFDQLSRHAGDPLPDLVRRVIAALGLETELVAHGGRRDALAQLTRLHGVIGDYVGRDLDASLAGFLAFCEVERAHGVGFDQAVPSEQNSVKLLTVHKAKGLEWRNVYLPFLIDKVFPSGMGSDNHLRTAEVLPAPLRGDADGIPQLRDISNDALTRYGDELKAEQRLAEDRLAYVAVTRAKMSLIASWHRWDAGVQRPRVPSPYWQAIEGEARRQGRVAARAPDEVGEHPGADEIIAAAWPADIDEAAMAERRRAAEWVAEYRRSLASGAPGADDPMSAEATALVAGWDADLELLLAQAAQSDQTTIDVEIPESLSVTALAALHNDPQGWAAALLRPMPQAPSRAAELGTRFHAWVQRRSGLASLFDEEEVVADSDAAFRRLCAAFERGPYADRVACGVEVPFVLNLGAHVVRGRIDAVYRDGDGFQVVDWKTSQRPADPVQLALYRLAWAQAAGVSIDEVDAVFYHVLSGEVVRPDALPTQAELIALVASAR